MWKIKSEAVPLTTGGKWHHLKIFQKIPEKLIGKARSQGATENSYTGQGTHTAESTTVKVQSIEHGKYRYIYKVVQI
jgi:hypothetical protein